MSFDPLYQQQPWCDDAALLYTLFDYPLDVPGAAPLLDTAVTPFTDLHASPSPSSTSSGHTPEYPAAYASYSPPPLHMQHFLPPEPPRPARTTPYPPAGDRHVTYEVDTGEDAVVRTTIHRLSDDEKRSLPAPPSVRPTFLCLAAGCHRFLLHRAQVRPHLAEHGYHFPKPFRCSCGAEFGRQVEAARHVEDKKPCATCHRAGRKYKGGSVCIRCLRHQRTQ